MATCFAYCKSRLRLSNDEVRIAVSLSIGAPRVRKHMCKFGEIVQPNAHHGLACRRSAGRMTRHRLANDVLVRAFRRAETHAELQPTGFVRGDRKRPDGVTLISIDA